MANYNLSLQEKALDLAERLRAKVPGLYYGLLIQKKGIQAGACFGGNKKYAEIPLCRLDTIKSHAIHVDVHDSGNSIYITYQSSGENCLSEAQCEKIVDDIKSLGIPVHKYNRNAARKWKTDDLSEDSLIQICQIVMSELKNGFCYKRGKKCPLLYDESTFNQLLKKHKGVTLEEAADGHFVYKNSTQLTHEVATKASDNKGINPNTLEYAVAHYLTQFDGQKIDQKTLEKMINKMYHDKSYGSVLSFHLFGMLFPEQIGTKCADLAKNGVGLESYKVEIQKGINIGKYLRQLIKDGFMPIEIDKNDETYHKYLTALRTKPFMLLAGISGTGKSRIVRELAYRSCPDIDDLRSDSTTPGNYLMVEVKPNWHDSSELLGYYSQLANDKKGGYQFTKFVHFLVKALRYPEVPFFVCLDEMNLAPVEQYFAEFLSVLETRRHVGGSIKTGRLVEEKYMKELDGWNGGDLGLPDNVFIIGTVNMDDTTHQFSRKVIDRAMTIEMNGEDLTKMFGHNHELQYTSTPWTMQNNLRCYYVTADEMLEKHPRGSEKIKNELVGFLTKVNTCLENTPFVVSYRVLNELCIYLGNILDEVKPTTEEGLAECMKKAEDQITLMKILPRIEGDEDLFSTRDEKNKLEQLMELFDTEADSRKKLIEMNNRLKNGFTRFWP